MTTFPDELTTSPGTPADAVRTGWFVICVTGAVVPQAFASWAIAAVILVGMILVVHEKDQRYPTRSWPEAYRAYRAAHRWQSVWTVFVAAFILAGLNGMADGKPRGAFIVCLGLYYLTWLAAPVRTAVAEQGDVLPSD